MEIIHKIKLDSGKLIELTEEEFQEFKSKFEKVVQMPYFIPYVQKEYPMWPQYPWYTVTFSGNARIE